MRLLLDSIVTGVNRLHLALFAPSPQRLIPRLGCALLFFLFVAGFFARELLSHILLRHGVTTQGVMTDEEGRNGGKHWDQISLYSASARQAKPTPAPSAGAHTTSPALHPLGVLSPLSTPQMTQPRPQSPDGLIINALLFLLAWISSKDPSTEPPGGDELSAEQDQQEEADFSASRYGTTL